MRTLNRKLLRDIVALRGQAAAIAVVIAAGVMTLILTVTVLDAIRLSQERFYRDQHFAHVFAELKRAPEHVVERLQVVSGINLLETRVRAPLRLEVEGFADPVSGVAVSLPDGRQPLLNRLHLRAGSLPAPERNDQVLVSEPFALAHGLRAGDTLRAIIQGRMETLVISGVALSPEYVYQIAPGDLMPDYQRHAVLWMNRRALGMAFGMDGAFNSVVATLQAGASESDVIAAIDTVLAPWGGVGAYGREDLPSHRILDDEIGQLEVMAIVLPAVFLGVSAFLLSVLLGRIIRGQRQEIAVLKAFGYAGRDIAGYYARLTGLIVLIGSLLGMILGAWAARSMASLYAEYFRFPELSFHFEPRVLLLALLVAGGAAAFGTWRAVASAVSLPPAAAMRPPAPEHFRRDGVVLIALGRLLGQSERIILRNLLRHRFKAALSATGVALSGALLLLGSYQFNAVDHLIDVQYRLVQKADVNLGFTDPTPARALAELRHHPGVLHAEGYRSVPVRLVHGTSRERTAILGTDADPALRTLVDAALRPVKLPDAGLVMTDFLAERLGVVPGMSLSVEVMEGRRQVVDVELAAVVSEPVGVSAYMERRALNRLLGEGPAINGAWLLTDRADPAAPYASLRELPRVASVGLVGESEATIRAYIDDTMLVMMGVLLLLAGCVAFAVVYNNARIAFTERSRELATLRVLGFTRGEVAWILIGEMLLLCVLAIPLGWLCGTAFAWLLSQAISMDLMRIPFLVTPRAYAFSALGVLLAAALSVMLIGRRLHRLELVSALKTVE